MKPEELQLGDIVATTPSGMPIKVAAIHRKKVAYHACTDRFSWVRIGLLQPIPLTPEILEENGFKKGKTQYYQDFYEFWSEDLDRCIYLYVYEEYFLLFDNSNADIKYVHELQHAIKLCGINKEIEI